jgi:hypothetical protein
MADTVYLFGAGINRSIRDWDGLVPPLSTDFFQQALRHHRIKDDHYKEKLRPVFDYIARYWKLTPKELESEPFDIESCFTLLELQSQEALSKNDRDAFIPLAQIKYRLTVTLAEYLSDFDHFTHSSESFRFLGKIIHDQKPVVLTFNYDTLLESAIEAASGVNVRIPPSFRGRPPESGDIPDEELSYSHMNWNRPLGYGVKFDEVQLHRAGVSTFVPGERFYGHPSNNLYFPPLLKLHGSINWFIYSGVNKYPFGDNTAAEEKKGKTLLFEGSWWFNEAPDLYGIIIEPIIITPVVHKQIHEIPIIPAIWKKAAEEMAGCKTLVIGGYSFPPTDFHSRRLFLEAFSDHLPEEIAIINPDTRIVQLVKDLCHFKKPVLVCKDLDEFITSYTKHA